ncbi:MAG: phospholipase D-like domain-containing protein, partial [Nanoarchaeota archaeon]
KEEGILEVHFCQQENCSNYLLKLIENSRFSVHCAFFDLDLPEIINTLDKKDDLDVKLVIDNENNDGIIGNRVKYDTSSQYSHNKFCIFDDNKIITGSFNPTSRGNYKNDNNIVIVESKNLAENYEDEFIELWDERFGEGEEVNTPVIYINNIRIENYFCPDDQCADHIIETIKKAKESIYFMTFSFTHTGIADAILFKDVKIKGIFEKSQAGSQYSQYQRFKDFGIDVIKDNNSANMHHKVFIIDESIVITGSMNPSSSGDNKNDENILIIYDEEIAKEYLDEFERIWNLK